MTTRIYTITKAKAEFSSIISNVQAGDRRIFITKKNKNVAVIIPFADYKRSNAGNGLLNVKGSLSDSEVDEFVDNIYAERNKSVEREVSI